MNLKKIKMNYILILLLFNLIKANDIYYYHPLYNEGNGDGLEYLYCESNKCVSINEYYSVKVIPKEGNKIDVYSYYTGDCTGDHDFNNVDGTTEEPESKYRYDIMIDSLCNERINFGGLYSSIENDLYKCFIDDDGLNAYITCGRGYKYNSTISDCVYDENKDINSDNSNGSNNTNSNNSNDSSNNDKDSSYHSSSLPNVNSKTSSDEMDESKSNKCFILLILTFLLLLL